MRGDQSIELVLVKNPSGFRLGLSSFPPDEYITMIAINDNYADGRDMSWLWDVSFESLQANGVEIVSGIRAYDMALRLQYDDVKITTITPDIAVALDTLLRNTSSAIRIYCTYTAMLAIRKQLANYTSVRGIDQ